MGSGFADACDEQPAAPAGQRAGIGAARMCRHATLAETEAFIKAIIRMGGGLVRESRNRTLHRLAVRCGGREPHNPDRAPAPHPKVWLAASPPDASPVPPRSPAVRSGAPEVTCSLDLDRTTTTVTVEASGWTWRGQRYPYLEKCKERTIYYCNDGEFAPVSRYGASLIKLVPTGMVVTE